MQTVNEASRNAKTLKLHSEVGLEHEGAEVRTTSRNSAPFKVAEVKKTSEDAPSGLNAETSEVSAPKLHQESPPETEEIETP